MSRLFPQWAAVLSIVVPALLAGCSGGNATGTVRGEVTLDGRPLERGIIRFVPANGQAPTADAGITDGKFTATVPVGEMKVEITAPKVVGKHKMFNTADSPQVDAVTELIPPRYNVRSELKMTVRSGSQEKSFRLRSR
jgi:hypothetical protein